MEAVGEDIVDFAAKIKRLGLKVERIVSVHGRVGTIEDLRRSIAASKFATTL